MNTLYVVFCLKKKFQKRGFARDALSERCSKLGVAVSKVAKVAIDMAGWIGATVCFGI